MRKMILHYMWVPPGVLLAVAVLLALLAILLLRGHERKSSSEKHYRLPPSPSGAWPLIGHFPLLGTLPHRTLTELAKKYGPLMYLRLGNVPVVVVSSADMLREFFQVNDVIMASRPVNSAFQILGFNRQTIAAQPYCDQWRDMRKLFMQELLSMKRLNELQDFLLGGTETIATVLEWLLADLQLHPEAMMEVQREMDEVAGRNRLVNESDIPNLVYLQACVKESMRLHPTVPLMLPHESTASCTIAGYYIPAKVRVLINMAAIHLNPETYDEPEMFRPERFLLSGPNSHFELRGQHFDLVPFGTGRRICMGLSLGLLMVHLGAAVLLQSCDWKLPTGNTARSLDMSEALGSVAHMKVPLQLVPSPRLPAHVYAAENVEI